MKMQVKVQKCASEQIKAQASVKFENEFMITGFMIKKAGREPDKYFVECPGYFNNDGTKHVYLGPSDNNEARTWWHKNIFTPILSQYHMLDSTIDRVIKLYDIDPVDFKNLNVKVNRYIKDYASTIKAFAKLNIGDIIKVDSIKIINGKSEKAFVNLPTYTVGRENEQVEYKEYCYPLNADLRKRINEITLNAYREMLQEKDSYKSSEKLGKLSTISKPFALYIMDAGDVPAYSMEGSTLKELSKDEVKIYSGDIYMYENQVKKVVEAEEKLKAAHENNYEPEIDDDLEL
jgi:DNA-binding cell septation regulator SpoVG